MRLSLVIPAYNEEARISNTLSSLLTCAKSPMIAEIIVVDDGSDDCTVDMASHFIDVLPLRIISLPQNKGKGAASRIGVFSAKGDVVALYDADGATPPKELARLCQVLRTSGADIVIGSRVLGRNGIVTMQRHRRMTGRIFHTICRPLLPGIGDASCGCKVFTKKAAHDVFAKQTIDRFAFDIEVLHIALKRGYWIREIPVEWRAVQGSKVRLWKDGWEMLRAVASLYVRLLYPRRPTRHS